MFANYKSFPYLCETIADKTQITMKHTPEPWYFVDYAGYHELTDAPFYEAIHLLNEDDAPNAADNANRACECVNALAGIENPKEWVEFSKNYRTMLQWEKLESQVKELREANVELLDSLKETLFRFRSLHDKLTFKQRAQSIDFDKWPVVVRAKSVIDKAQLLNKQP